MKVELYRKILYRKIYKVLNEDLNMILSDDDFEDSEIDLGVHIQNVQKKINIQILKKNVAGAIENNDSKGLKVLIENEWDEISKIFVATNKDIQHIVSFSRYALGNNANLNWIDTSNVTDMSRLFSYSLFNGDISGWDVSSVENMESMFYDSVFNGDISKWNVSNVTNMWCMFEYSKFNGDISEWDVSKVINMSYMFYGSKFNQDISKWDVSNVQDVYDMNAMFENCPIKEEYKPKFNR